MRRSGWRRCLQRGDPLEAIDRLVPWESFRRDVEAVVLTPDELKKSSAGRKPVDAIVLFRMLVLQALRNLSDEQAEYQVRDRLSLTRFLRLGIEAAPGLPLLRQLHWIVTADPASDTVGKLLDATAGLAMSPGQLWFDGRGLSERSCAAVLRFNGPLKFICLDFHVSQYRSKMTLGPRTQKT
jgi:hypothetical protein